VAALATVVNRLAGRIRGLLAAERELVADLSHRLRTPITALRLDSEGLRDPEEADRLGADVDALERAVDEVIRDARRPADERTTGCDAAAVVRDRTAFWSVLAEDQGRVVRDEVVAGEVPVGVAPADLAAAVDGLLANVLAHTPEGTAFTVRLERRTGGGARLAVEDDGPGLRPEAIERGRSGAGSTGLGLDIARRTAEASGGRLLLGRGPAGGAAVVLELGPPA
jgi:signal transduction histidine kinase